MTQTDRLAGLIGSVAIKAPVVTATTANITLSGLQTLDGVTVVAGDRVLVKNQTDASENGIYDADTGDWNRSEDFDGPYDVVCGTMVKVNEGATTSGFWYVTTDDPITIDTTNITWGQASSVLATVSSFMQTVLTAATSLVAKATLKVPYPPTNIVPNSSMGICTALPLVRVGSVAAVSAFSDVGVNQGTAQFNSGNSVSGHCQGIVPGKLFLVEGSGTPRAPNVLLSATVTGNNKITAAAGSFTGVQVGDVAEITSGGTNTSPKLKYRVTATDASTYVDLYGGTTGTILVNEAAVTFNITWYEGSKDVDATVNGMPSTGNTSNPAIIGYPLQATECNVGSFLATLAGKVLAVAGSAACNAWEVTPGDDGFGTGDACDGWTKTSTLRYWRTYLKDWDGTTSVVQDGESYGCKVKKGAAGVEYLYALLAVANGVEDRGNEIEKLQEYKGKNIAFGMYWKPAGASTARPFIYDGITRTYGDYYTAGSMTWEEVTAEIATTATTVQVGLEITGSIDDIHYGTQPMGLLGQEVGEGNYTPTKGLHVFNTHPNFSQSYVNGTVTTSCLIRIEQESIGALPRGLAGIYCNLEGQNTSPPVLSGTASLNTGFAIWEGPSTRLPCITMYDTYGTASQAVSTGGATVGAGATQYMGDGAASATEADVQFRVPFACKVYNLYTQSSSGPVGGETFTYTLMKNGVAQALTCQTTGASTQGSDTDITHAISFAAGDLLSVRVVTSGGAAVVRHNAGFELYKTSHVPACNAGLVIVGKKTEYDPSDWRTDCMWIAVGQSPSSGWNGVNIDMVAAQL